MGQEPDQIERHIHQTRARLEENVAELRSRVRSNLDWRTQYRRYPGAFAAAAFGGGLVLALLLGRTIESSRLRRRALDGTLLAGIGSGRDSLRTASPRASWNEIVETLVALGPAQVRGLFGELLPALHRYLATR